MVDGYQRLDRWLARWIPAAALAVVLVCVTGCGNGGSAAGRPGTTASGETDAVQTVDFPIEGVTFRLELALDDASRTQGLSDRKSIAGDGGMLFVFPTPVRTQFVMRRCYVPIDLIFIDEDGYIDSLHAMEVIEPVGGSRWKNPSSGYPSAGFIRYAVELKGGTIAELGLVRGTKMNLPDAVLQLRSQ